MKEPFQKKCSDGPWLDYWTSPCCYERIENSGDQACPSCGRLIFCETQYQPFNVATLIEEKDR